MRWENQTQRSMRKVSTTQVSAGGIRKYLMVVARVLHDPSAYADGTDLFT